MVAHIYVTQCLIKIKQGTGYIIKLISNQTSNTDDRNPLNVQYIQAE